MVDSRLIAALTDPHQSAAVRDFLLVLAACNTVVPTAVKRLPGTPVSGTPPSQGSFAPRAFESPQVSSLGRPGAPPVQLEYQAESPDELAFVAAAAAYGFTLLERTAEAIVVDVQGSRER
jgi:phospholipid-transporting ATPase